LPKASPPQPPNSLPASLAEIGSAAHGITTLLRILILGGLIVGCIAYLFVTAFSDHPELASWLLKLIGEILFVTKDA
jgi:hypothetical protein